MIITLNGPAGSGKSTIGRLLCEKLGYKFYSGGDFRRLKAKELDITIEEFNKLGETESYTDTEADAWVEKLGKTEDNFIMTSRTGAKFIPHSLKVYLKIDPDEAAKRVFEDRDDIYRINQTKVSTLEEQEKFNIERDRSDRLRYKKWYDIDINDEKLYDVVIDTTKLNKEQVTDKILEHIKK